MISRSLHCLLLLFAIVNSALCANNISKSRGFKELPSLIEGEAITFLLHNPILKNNIKPLTFKPSLTVHRLFTNNKLPYQLTISDFNITTDLSKIRQIFKQNWPKLVSYEYNQENEDAVINTFFKERKSIDHHPCKVNIKVVRKNDNSIGFIGYGFYSSERRAMWPRPPADIGHIEVIAVDSEERRLGAASLLMKHAMQEIAKDPHVKKIEIAVNKNNIPACKCYGKFGFVFDRKHDDNHIFLSKKVSSN